MNYFGVSRSWIPVFLARCDPKKQHSDDIVSEMHTHLQIRMTQIQTKLTQCNHKKYPNNFVEVKRKE